MMLAGAMEGIAGDLFFQMVVQGKRRGCLDGTEVAMAGIMGALSGGLGGSAVGGGGKAFSGVAYEVKHISKHVEGTAAAARLISRRRRPRLSRHGYARSR